MRLSVGPVAIFDVAAGIPQCRPHATSRKFHVELARGASRPVFHVERGIVSRRGRGRFRAAFGPLHRRGFHVKPGLSCRSAPSGRFSPRFHVEPDLDRWLRYRTPGDDRQACFVRDPVIDAA